MFCLSFCYQDYEKKLLNLQIESKVTKHDLRLELHALTDASSSQMHMARQNKVTHLLITQRFKINYRKITSEEQCMELSESVIRSQKQFLKSHWRRWDNFHRFNVTKVSNEF